MVYHNLYHRVDGILLTSSKYGECQLRINRGGGGGGGQPKRGKNFGGKDNGVSSEMCIHVLCIV